MVGRWITLGLVAAGLALAGCNTVRGAGEDIESVADAGDEVI